MVRYSWTGAWLGPVGCDLVLNLRHRQMDLSPISETPHVPSNRITAFTPSINIPFLFLAMGAFIWSIHTSWAWSFVHSCTGIQFFPLATFSFQLLFRCLLFMRWCLSVFYVDLPMHEDPRFRTKASPPNAANRCLPPPSPRPRPLLRPHPRRRRRPTSSSAACSSVSAPPLRMPTTLRLRCRRPWKTGRLGPRCSASNPLHISFHLVQVRQSSVCGLSLS